MRAGLRGKRIVNTRAKHQAEALDNLLRAYGAEPLSYPCIAIVPPDDTTMLDDMLCDIVAGRFDWLILTSTNTVLILGERLQALGLSLTGAANLKIAAVGPMTADAARQSLAIEIELMPDRYVAEALADAIKVSSGARIALPQSAIARPVLHDQLCAAGSDVTVVTAYHTVCGVGGVDLPHLLSEQVVDAVVFTSSSTVANCLHRMKRDGGSVDDLVAVSIACIGPRTAETARELGLEVSVMPDDHTLNELVESLEAHFSDIKTGVN